jgi:hypothetical protein
VRITAAVAAVEHLLAVPEERVGLAAAAKVEIAVQRVIGVLMG